MIDPRVDVCFPFPELCVRIPADQACRVQSALLESLTGFQKCVVEQIARCPALFYDLFRVLGGSTINLELYAPTPVRTELGRGFSNYFFTLAQDIQRASSDALRIITEAYVLQQIPKTFNIAALGYSPWWIFVFACLEGCYLSDAADASGRELVSRQLVRAVDACVDNRKQSLGGRAVEGEARFRLFLLSAGLQAAADSPLPLAVHRLFIEHCMASIHKARLLPLRERLLALDIAHRVVALSRGEFAPACEEIVLSLISSIVNRPISASLEAGAPGDGGDNGETAGSTEAGSPGSEALIELRFDALPYLPYQIVLFVVAALRRLINACTEFPAPPNLLGLSQDLETAVLNVSASCSPCIALIGVLCAVGRYADVLRLCAPEQVDRSHANTVNAVALANAKEQIQTQLDAYPIIYTLADAVLHLYDYIDVVFYAVDGRPELDIAPFPRRAYSEVIQALYPGSNLTETLPAILAALVSKCDVYLDPQAIGPLFEDAEAVTTVQNSGGPAGTDYLGATPLSTNSLSSFVPLATTRASTNLCNPYLTAALTYLSLVQRILELMPGLALYAYLGISDHVYILACDPRLQRESIALLNRMFSDLEGVLPPGEIVTSLHAIVDFVVPRQDPVATDRLVLLLKGLCTVDWVRNAMKDLFTKTDPDEYENEAFGAFAQELLDESEEDM